MSENTDAWIPDVSSNREERGYSAWDNSDGFTAEVVFEGWIGVQEVENVQQEKGQGGLFAQWLHIPAFLPSGRCQMTVLASGMWAQVMFATSWADMIKKRVYHVLELFPCLMAGVRGSWVPKDGRNKMERTWPITWKNCPPNQNTHIELLKKWGVNFYCALPLNFWEAFVLVAGISITYTSIRVSPVSTHGGKWWAGEIWLRGVLNDAPWSWSLVLTLRCFIWNVHRLSSGGSGETELLYVDGAENFAPR